MTHNRVVQIESRRNMLEKSRRRKVSLSQWSQTFISLGTQCTTYFAEEKLQLKEAKITSKCKLLYDSKIQGLSFFHDFRPDYQRHDAKLRAAAW